jgi:hypothetical protein
MAGCAPVFTYGVLLGSLRAGAAELAEPPAQHERVEAAARRGASGVDASAARRAREALADRDPERGRVHGLSSRSLSKICTSSQSGAKRSRT